MILPTLLALMVGFVKGDKVNYADIDEIQPITQQDLFLYDVMPALETDHCNVYPAVNSFGDVSSGWTEAPDSKTCMTTGAKQMVARKYDVGLPKKKAIMYTAFLPRANPDRDLDPESYQLQFNSIVLFFALDKYDERTVERAVFKRDAIWSPVGDSNFARTHFLLSETGLQDQTEGQTAADWHVIDWDSMPLHAQNTYNTWTFGADDTQTVNFNDANFESQIKFAHFAAYGHD